MLDHVLVSNIFAGGILLLQANILIIVIAYLFDRDGWVIRFVNKYALWFVLFAAVCAIVGSLTYSEIVGFDPCKLCWFQRIFLYPSFFIALVALIVKDAKPLRYTLILSLIGITISIYHYLIQTTGISALPCSATGQGPSCGGIYVKEFGYITIPMMALTLYAYTIVASWIGLSRHKEKVEEIGV